MKKIWIVVLVALLQILPVSRATASHDLGDTLDKLVLGVGYGLMPAGIWIPMNIVDGLAHRGHWLNGLLGIGTGAVQASFGGALFVSAPNGDRSRHKRIVGGLNLGLGVANIGAGIFALTRRAPPAVTFMMGAASADGMQPGLTVQSQF